MIVTNFRIEAPSNRPSPLQTMVNAWTTGLDATSFGWELISPYQAVQAMYRFNRSVVKVWLGL